MDIQFRCTSVSHFDQKTGSYKVCHQLLQATEDNVGLKVRCPRCNQMIVVPSPQLAATAAGGRERSPSGNHETVVQVESSLAYGKFDKYVHCPKCGTALDEQKKCTACRYEMSWARASTTPLEQMDCNPAGFQLWFRNIMSDGVGVTLFEVALHSFMIIVVMGCVLMAVVMGGAGAIYILIAASLLTFLYVVVVVQTKRLGRVPAARLPFYMKLLWNLILRIARSQNWQKYDGNLSGRLIIDVRDEPFGDRELLALEKLNVCEVLDAQGTDITDNSLVAMHGLKHLRCLVLRKTHVTNEAVFRLQQSLPKCWIWH